MKKILYLMMAAIMCIALAACAAQPQTQSPAAVQSTASPSDETPPVASLQQTFKIGYCSANNKTPFQAKIATAAKETANKLGVELDVQDGEDDPNVQTTIMQTFITQKKDLIIVCPSQINSLVPIVKECNKAKIPVMTVNRELGEGADVLTYVGIDCKQGGYYAGEILGELLEGKGNVVYLVGVLGSSPQVQEEEGLMEYINAKAPEIKIIAKQNSDWDKATAITVTQNFLTRFPKGQIDAILTQGPDDAVGSVEACKAAGRTELLGKIIGFDFPQNVVDAMDEGTVYGTILQDPSEQGILCVQTAYDYLTGKATNIGKQTVTSLPKITLKNYKEYLDRIAW